LNPFPVLFVFTILFGVFVVFSLARKKGTVQTMEGDDEENADAFLKWVGEDWDSCFIIWNFNCDYILFKDSGIGNVSLWSVAFGWLYFFFLGKRKKSSHREICE
jgi:hypothetical protein